MQRISKKQLKDTIKYEKKIYLPKAFKKRFIFKFTNNERYLIFKYLKFLRKEEYYIFRGGFYKLLWLLVRRKKNRLGNNINIKIEPFFAGKGINIHHKNVIINGYIGEDCIFHGDNCIGEKKRNKEDEVRRPRIGDQVNIGYGAIVLGGVFIEDEVKIGAGAVVVKDILEKGATVMGVPAKTI